MAVPQEFFVIKHDFLNLKNMAYGKHYFGKKERYFDCSWRICIYRYKGKLIYSLEMSKNRNDRLIEVRCESCLTTSTQTWTAREDEWHWSDDGDYWNDVKWNEVRKHLNDGKLTVRFTVFIKKIDENPNRPQTPNQSTEVILVVEDEQLIVSKELIMSHSTLIHAIISKQRKQQNEIILSNVYMDDLLELLDVLEGKEVVNDNTVDGILHVAIVYVFGATIKECLKFLMEKSEKSKNEKLEIAEKYNLQELKTFLTRFDNSDFCVISTESLQCTVCYEIFDANPQMLQCGHTFCSSCVKKLSATISPYYVPSFNCPICRKSVRVGTSIQNFSLKSIMESIDVLSKEESSERTPFECSMHTSNQHLRRKLENSEKEAQQLRKTLEESERTGRQLQDRVWKFDEEKQQLRLKCEALERVNYQIQHRTMFSWVTDLF